MRTRWVAGNVIRFVAVWLVVVGAAAIVLRGDLTDHDPTLSWHHLAGVPAAIVLYPLIGLVVAAVALALFSPFVVVWLAFYLALLAAVARVRRRRVARALAVLSAPATSLPFLDHPDIVLFFTALVLMLVYGAVARPYPQLRS